MAQLTSTGMVLARAFIDLMGKGHNYLEGDAIPNVVPNPWFHAARLESAGFMSGPPMLCPFEQRPTSRR